MLNSSRLSPLILLAVNIILYFVIIVKLPLYIAVYYINYRLFFGLINQYKAISLAYVVFPITLLTEITLSPIAIFPTDLVIVIYTYIYRIGIRTVSL